MSPPLEIDLRLPLEAFELRVELALTSRVTGFFGPSGAGKTSLLEAIAGLRRRARGRLSLGDEVWLDSGAGRRLPTQARGVGWVPQEALLFPHLDVRRNLLAGSRRARRAGYRPAELLASVCALLELEPLLERLPATLSGGERRRVAVGRALCSGPRLLLLDEPLASLDLPLRRRLLPLLRRLRADPAPPAIVVSHDPTEVQALCDELVVLHRGRVVARGEPHAVLSDPKIFPLADEEGFENVLAGSIASHAGATSQVRLGAERPLELTVLRIEGEIGAEVLVGLPSSEIVLATERPRGLSARNVLPARVEAIRRAGDSALVVLRLAPDLPALTVEVVETTPGQLGLATGREVYAIVKATSCRLYGR